MQRFFLCWLITVGCNVAVHAQTLDADIEKGVRLYNQMRSYDEKLSSATVKDSNINRLKDFIAQGTPFFSGALNNGTAAQQKVARYFTAMLQYELGFIYGMKGENYKAYEVLKKIDTVVRYYSDSTQFPLKYLYNSKNYSITFSNFAPTAAEYYTGMGEVCTNIKRYQEAVNYMQLAANFPYTTPWYKYIAASKLWENSRYLNLRNEQYLQQTLTALQMCSRLDTGYQRAVKVNQYAGNLRFADTLYKLLQENPSWSQKGVVLGTAAAYLDSAKENAAAMLMYRKAIAQGLTNKVLLRQAETFAMRTNNAGFINEVAVAIKNAYTNEPDEVVRNLSSILTQVVASANDPSKHFSEMQGKPMTSRRHGGKLFRSSVELPGAIESFVTSFLDNKAANYYYWKSFIDEEAPAQLKGRLRQRYKAVCDEIRSIYPGIPVTYQFNNDNYFQMVLNKSTTIEVDYYYNQGYKDVILLTIISSYPK